MMDYNASITYTHPGHRTTSCGPSRPTTRAASSACSARCAGAPTPAARATARSTRSSSTHEHEVDLPADRHRHQLHDHHADPVPGPDRDRAVRAGARAARRHRRDPRLPDRSSTSRTTDVRIGMRVAAVWASEAEKADLGLRPPRATSRLDAHRRARRRRPRPREQDQLMAATHPTTSRIIGWNVSPMVRSTDKTEAQMLLEVITGAVDDAGITRERGRLHLRRAAATTSPARRSRSCRTSTPSARGRPSATRTSRWTARGRCTRRGSACSSATSTSRWRWARAARRPPTRRSSTRWRWTRTTWLRWAPTRRQLRRAAGPGAASTRARSPSGRWPRSRPARRRDAQGNPHAQVSGDFDVDDAARRGLRPRAAAPPRPAADHRRRVRRRDRPRPTRPVSCASNPVWITGFAHCSELHYPGMRDLTLVAVDHARGQGGRARRGAGRGGRAPGRVHPRGAAAGRGARPRRRRGGQPVGRPARRQPDHGHRPGPRHRGGPARSATAGSTARSRTRRRARACSRTSSASWKGTTE